MKAITLRGIPRDVERLIRRKASERGTSLNKSIIGLLEEAAGIRKARRKVLHHDLDALAGAWNREEAEEFDRCLAVQRKIEPALWR